MTERVPNPVSHDKLTEPSGFSTCIFKMDGSAPLYHEVSPFTKLMLRILAASAGLVVLITVIISFVKAADDSMMYLIAVNMLISSVIGGVIAWWYHKGIIEAKKVAFMAFVGVCIIFQAIISDVYVYNKKAVISSPTVSPTSSPAPTTHPNSSFSI
ncbi:unnamed protein product [Porites evermanni]|uniref:Uncharacterized protein n=1 Tax=Porites evermanni TaxID=104178 RepID=A0ABN8LR60_9CNID|nr:unnamed protein product [Porites evermanni]